MKTHSQKFLQQRRFYMVLPLLVFPFLTMIFWALGGGKGGEVQAQEMKSGLNMELPGAHFNKGEEVWDKFSLYEQAKRDSLKMEEAKRNDPYYVMARLEEMNTIDTVPSSQNKLNTSLGAKNHDAQIDKDEKEITQKLELLTKQLSAEELKPRQNVTSTMSRPAVLMDQTQAPASEEVQHLEKMMQLMNDEGSSDPEMKQIDGMLEKILDIQHPERVKDKIRAESQLHEKTIYPVTTIPVDDNISLLTSTINSSVNDSLVSEAPQQIENTSIGFYGLAEDGEIEEKEPNAIEAVIHDDQTVVTGSIVKMRLLSDVYIKGQLIPKDQFIYGVCAISGERLTIQINSIRDDHDLFAVAMDVYDLDGLPGIYIPGAISRDVAKQTASQSIQDIQMYSMNNSLEVQAATAGIEAAKGLFSKKAKLIKVTLKAGYQILLKDKNATSK